MNFTREPIIETVITPKDGYKLVIRNTKGKSEEYTVDAVEVVNFGGGCFFRCLERPKSFIVPASDYEVVETKETRVVLKNAPIEKNIKIAGGRVKKDDEPQSLRKTRSRKPQARRPQKEDRPKEDRPKEDRPKEDRPKEERSSKTEKPKPKQKQAPKKENSNKENPKRVSSTMFRSLFPPPKTLIGKKLQPPEDTPPLENKENNTKKEEDKPNAPVGKDDPVFPDFEKPTLPS